MGKNVWKTLHGPIELKKKNFAIACNENRYILIAGGAVTYDEIFSHEGVTMYDVVTQEIYDLPDLPADKYLGPCSNGAVLKGYFYVFNNYIHRLDLSFPLSSRWERIPCRREINIRSVQSVISDGNHFYLFYKGIHHNIRYDPDTREWKKLPPMSTPRTEFSVAVVKDNIYILGGLDYFDGKSARYLSSVEIFHIPSESWREGPSLPKPSLNAASAVTGNFITVVGGCDDKNLSSKSFILDTFTQKWAQSDFGLTPPRVGHRCVGIGESDIITVGGSHGSTLIQHCPIEAAKRKDLVITNWDILGHLILLRYLSDKGRAFPQKCDASNTTIQNLITYLSFDMFAEVLSFLASP